MTIRVLTLDREFGSGGGDIAKKMAANLGWKLWDQALTDEIARHLNCGRAAVEELEEKRDPIFHRLLKAFTLGSFEGSLNAPRLRMVDTERVRNVVEKLLPEIADAGDCVIVGRGSAYLLGNRPDAFHVFIYAPFQQRVRRLRAQGKTEQEAIQLVETVDRDRADFIQRYFNLEWPGRHRFHMMINSGLGDDAVADIICHAIGCYTKQRAARS